MTASQRYTVVIQTHTSVADLAPLHSFVAEGSRGQVLTCKQSAWVTRSDGDVHVSQSPEADVLCRVKFKPHACVVSPASVPLGLALGRHRFEALYSTCRLWPGNEIRLGNVTLRLRDVQGWAVATPLRSGALHAQGLEDSPVPQTKTVSAVRGQTCRICLGDEEELVQPCACSGSVGTVHPSCLKQWLNSKLSIDKHRDTFSLKWRNFKCEICHEAYPDALLVHETVHELVQIPRAASKFLVLERVGSDKVLYVVPLRNKKQVVLGRGPAADVLLNDSHVALTHAVLHASKAGVFLEDCGSEFGTSLVLKQPVVVRAKQALALQAGCTVMSMRMKKKRSFARWLCGGSK